jgi:hypothetical protein
MVCGRGRGLSVNMKKGEKGGRVGPGLEQIRWCFDLVLPGAILVNRLKDLALDLSVTRI